jgi:hypothetical protein
MVVDEEGRIKQKPINRAATQIIRALTIGQWPIIVGDVLICPKEQIG